MVLGSERHRYTQDNPESHNKHLAIAPEHLSPSTSHFERVEAALLPKITSQFYLTVFRAYTEDTFDRYRNNKQAPKSH
ncbi:hypothetical protein VN97_g10718 [Penicillium thymicola]|uniref:Uncharacterized protein n=1 Tax=Penicillium thymicola TaxID=293382 RepID=A0AAI9T9C2_PENTH|nr:hypothetical protein VN97_g10718 [Penicillium thymicola]